VSDSSKSSASDTQKRIKDQVTRSCQCQHASLNQLHGELAALVNFNHRVPSKAATMWGPTPPFVRWYSIPFVQRKVRLPSVSPFTTCAVGTL
jgi:hypothetical protein